MDPSRPTETRHWPLAQGPLVLLALAATLGAQTFTFTAPAGYLEHSGGGRHGIWAYYMDGRVQFADPSLPRRKMVLTQVALRTQTEVSYTAATGPGRSFSSVRLVLGHTDCSKFGKVFSANYAAAGTTVTSGALTLAPHTAGIPTQVFGNAGSFPFSSTFAYDGSRDLLLDWTFAGGRLVNGQSVVGAFYLTDAPSSQTSLVVAPDLVNSGARFVPRAPRSGSICADSGQTGRDAYASVRATFYADSYPVSSLAGKVAVQDASSWFTRKNSNVIAALTVFGSDSGTIVAGALCNRLHVDLRILLAQTVRVADAFGNVLGHLPPTPIRYDSAYAEAPLYFQAAWADSSNGRLGLTLATKLVLPRKPLDTPPGCLLYQFVSGGSVVGPVGPSKSATQNMIERFSGR